MKQINNLLDNNNLEYLYSKKINRLAKVIYIFLYIIVLLFVFFIMIVESEDYYSTIVIILITIIIFEAIRRAFYYVSLGTIKPKKYSEKTYEKIVDNFVNSFKIDKKN